MKIFKLILTFLILYTSASPLFAQRSEISLVLNEPFFDSMIDTVFRNYDPPKFAVSDRSTPDCGTIKLQREMSGVRTTVKFREGRIIVPLVFVGNYELPLVGCVEYSGWADATMNLHLDNATQKVMGRLQVNTVNLNGTSGVGNTLLAGMVQSSIDKKMEPLEVLSLDRLTFGFPVKNGEQLKMKAVGVDPEVSNGTLTIKVEYVFVKGD